MSLLLIPNGEQQTQIMGKSGMKEVLLDSVRMLQGEKKREVNNKGQVDCTDGSLCVKERFISEWCSFNKNKYYKNAFCKFIVDVFSKQIIKPMYPFLML